MPFLIRAGTERDIEAAVGLHIRCWQSGYRGLIDDQALDSIDPMLWRARRKELWLDPVRIRLVASDGGSVLGFGDAGPGRDQSFPGSGEVYALYVDPDVQRGGIGSALLRALVAEMKGRGFRELIVKTLFTNPRARAFYEREGGVLAGRSEFEFGGRRYPEAVYRLP